MMRHLILYSHPNPESFNHAILEVFIRHLEKAGQDARVRDLYALNFNPVLTRSEMQGYEQGDVPDDIKAEQEHIRWAEMVTMICPIWWGGFTANLRGYLDRVFSAGFAYKPTPQGVEPLLADKKVYTINTLAAPGQVYEDLGLYRSMNNILDHIVFQFCGLQVVGHKYFAFVDASSDDDRQAMLREVGEIAERLSRL